MFVYVSLQNNQTLSVTGIGDIASLEPTIIYRFTIFNMQGRGGT